MKDIGFRKHNESWAGKLAEVAVMGTGGRKICRPGDLGADLQTWDRPGQTEKETGGPAGHGAPRGGLSVWKACFSSVRLLLLRGTESYR